MRTAELETTFRDKLEQAGLVAAMNEEKSQFLDLPDGFFAEIVLNDGSKLAGRSEWFALSGNNWRKRVSELIP